MKKKILALLMAGVSTLAVLSGCADTGNNETSESSDSISESVIAKAPDYSDSGLQFDFYGYSSAINGWNIDGISYTTGEDYKSVERIQEYKDAGMTIYFPQSAAAYSGQDFETSEIKRVMDNCLEAGIDKVILMDPRIQSLSKPAKENAVGLIGEGKQFATEADLDAVIREYMAPYREHEAFYGVMLGDEPFYYHTENYGQVYRSIKRVCPEAFIQYNLNPITAGVGENANGSMNIDVRFPALEEGDEGYGEELTEDDELVARYKKYIRGFMDATGANYVQYDHYPFRHADKVDEYYFLGLQIVAEIAKEYDANFYFVSQTYGQTDGVENPRMLSEADLYWINNALLGFGIKQISYFTYFTKADNNTEHFIDGNSFITWHGEKTDIYYWMQQIMAEEQKLAPTLLSFDYSTSQIIMKRPTIFNTSYALRTIETKPFTALTQAEVNKEVALVTELYDGEKDNYMYMVQNIIDSTRKGSKVYQTTTLTFDSKYEYAVVFFKGERTIQKLDEGKLIIKQNPGYATFVIPF